MRHPDVSDGHYEGTSLACELICSNLARLLELPVPDWFVVEIPRGLIPHIKEESVRRLFANNVGLNFGTTYMPDTKTWGPEMATPPDGIEDVLAFDATIVNGDRKTAKPNLIWDGRQFYMIDHSLGLPVHQWSDDVISHSPLFPDDNIREHCTFPVLAGRDIAFGALFARWSEKVTQDELETLRSFIPRGWEQQRGHLDKIFRFLRHRSERFSEIENSLLRVVK